MLSSLSDPSLDAVLVVTVFSSFISGFFILEARDPVGGGRPIISAIRSIVESHRKR